MKELILVIGPALPEAARALCTAPGYGPAGKAESETGGALPQRVIAHWDGWEAPEGEISLSARLRDELTQIRAEHMAWAHDTGRLRVSGCKSSTGSAAATVFPCGGVRCCTSAIPR